jgi:ribosomal protein L5
MHSSLDYFYRKEIRVLFLTKFHSKSIYDLDFLNKAFLELNFSNYKTETMTALSLLSNNSRNFKYTKVLKNSKFGKNNKSFVSLSLKKKLLISFLEKLVFLYLPQINYFKGFKISNINNSGSFSCTFRDLLIFPELEEELEFFYRLKNLKLIISLKKYQPIEKSCLLLFLLGIPFLDF